MYDPCSLPTVRDVVLTALQDMSGLAGPWLMADMLDLICQVHAGQSRESLLFQSSDRVVVAPVALAA